MKAYTSKLRALTATAALSVAALLSSTFAQTTATTIPVGFITATIKGKGTVDGTTALSVPLYSTPDFQGKVSALTSTNKFTLSGASWVANQFVLPPTGTATAPRLVRVKSGSQSGKFFRVTANTGATDTPANELTVDLTLYGLANINTVLAVDDTVEIVPANTIASVFASALVATPPLVPGTTATNSDNVLLQNGAGWQTYFFYNGTANGSPATTNKWLRDAGGTTDRGQTIIYPDDGIFVIRKTAGDVALTLMGTVPSTAEKSDVVAPNTFLANRFPTDTTLAALALNTIPGWVAGTSATGIDNVFILSASGAWQRYFFYNGTANGTPSETNKWLRDAGGTVNRGTTPIPAGSAVYISFGGAAQTLSQSLPYTP